jgi:hypothetical protein
LLLRQPQDLQNGLGHQFHVSELIHKAWLFKNSHIPLFPRGDFKSLPL